MGASTPSIENEPWYVYTGGKPQGPYPLDEVRALLRADLVPQDALFSAGGCPWIPRPEFEKLIGLDGGEFVPLEPITTEVQGGAARSAPEDYSDGAAPHEPPSHVAVATGATDELPLGAVPTRDRVVVVGRRAAGKTVYLATLYHRLWKSSDGFSMRALSGQAHRELILTYDTLQHREWPAATLRSTLNHMEFELEYRGRRRILVGLDYAGEVFRDAFVGDDAISPEAKALLSHIDRALAVMLMVDPLIAAGTDADAAMDDDFGIVQAVQRIRDWPGGEDVPVVVLLTKADRQSHARLFRRKGSTREFVATHYPALVRTLKKVKVFHVSAAQAELNEEGRTRPCADSTPMNVVEPLKYCLDVLDRREERKAALASQDADRRSMEQALRVQQVAEHRANKKLALLIASMIAIAVCILVLALVSGG